MSPLINKIQAIAKLLPVMKKTIFSLFISIILPTLAAQAQTPVSYFGATPDLKVSGKEFVDPTGKAVSLHGVMDTPNCYFNGGRWGWINYNSPSTNDINACKNYFTKVFEAITKKGGQGSTYCNLFRLHLDPAWLRNPNYIAPNFTNVNDNAKTATDPNGNTVFDEANICHFSFDKMRTRMNDLYVPIIKEALAHGLYVVVRPPGVFPEDVKVGDYYNTYLTTVWDIVSSDSYIKANSGKIMLELGNEPVRMSGNLADYFQPIVNKIRQNGFTGIILLPGTSYQADYRNYNSKPISDSNFGYAVHNYPGWYGGWDANQSEANFISTFETQVPINQKPIIITEVDWSPMSEGNGHWNETHTQFTEANFGTWGTGTTNGTTSGVKMQTTQNIGWGLRFRHLVDKHPNISFTLQGTSTYVDMDSYIANGKVQPAFYDQMRAEGYPDARQACSGYCFDWFYDFACGDRVPMDTGGTSGSTTEAGIGTAVGNAYYDATNKHYCFYTTYYSSFIFNDFNGEKLIDCADFTMDCGTCTTGYRLDVQLKDANGNIIKDGTNDYIIGSEEKGTRVTKENANKIFNMQTIFADYLKNYPGCTVGDIRINTAIEQEDANKQGLYYITINKMEMNIAQVRVQTSNKSLADIPLVRHTQMDETLHYDNGDNNLMGGWGGTITCENGIGTFQSKGYRLKNSKTQDYEAQVCYSGNYVKGVEYTLKMNVKGSVAGTISAAFQKSEGYEGRGNFGQYDVKTGYTEWKTTCTVTDDGCDRLLINYGGFPGDLFIDNVEIYTEAKGDALSGTNILLGKDATNGAEVFGAGLGGTVTYTDYADLTGYKKMTINGTGGGLRILFNRKANGDLIELNPSLESGSATIYLDSYPTFHLNSIKSAWGQTVNISSITLSGKTEDGRIAQVYFTGAGNITDEAKAVLADESITSIDITGMTNKFSQPLTSANPNCIIIYAAAQEVLGYGETENLMGSAFDARNLAKKDGNGNYSCWRTDLVDGYDFLSPINIQTVGGASYTRELTTEWATIALPFELNVAAAGSPEIYQLTAVDAEKMVFTKVESGTIAAGNVILYRNQNLGETVLTGKNIAQTAEGFNIQPLAGVDGWFTAQSFSSKVIDDVATDPVLKDYDVYGVQADKFVHATKKITLKPFRAFFLAKKGSSAAPKSSYLIATDEETTGISSTPEVQAPAAYYDISGRRISSTKSGITIIRKADGTIRKVVK